MEKQANAHVTDLIIETTRRCNMRCEHCLRGDPEDMDMPGRYLENIFSRVTAVDVLTFTGGEPALGTDAMYKALELCSRNHIPVREVYLATNGKSVNKKFLDALRQWDAYCRETQTEYLKTDTVGGTEAVHLVRQLTNDADGHVGIRIDLSMDRFHEDIPVENILALMSLPGVLGTGKYNSEDKDDWLIRTGQAEWNGMGDEDSVRTRPWAYGETAGKLDITLQDDGTYDIPTLYIACDGSICKYCDYDYRDMSEYALELACNETWLDTLAAKHLGDYD